MATWRAATTSSATTAAWLSVRTACYVGQIVRTGIIRYDEALATVAKNKWNADWERPRHHNHQPERSPSAVSAGNTAQHEVLQATNGAVLWLLICFFQSWTGGFWVHHVHHVQTHQLAILNDKPGWFFTICSSLQFCWWHSAGIIGIIASMFTTWWLRPLFCRSLAMAHDAFHAPLGGALHWQLQWTHLSSSAWTDADEEHQFLRPSFGQLTLRLWLLLLFTSGF